MDQEEIKKQIGIYYSKLSPAAQEVFSSMKWLENLESIGSKYNLNEEQIRTLDTETMLVLLSITHLEEYENILKNQLKVSEDSFKKIMEEINALILTPIHSNLIESFEKNNNSSENLKEEMEKSDWGQNVNFILSGGDYSHFLEKTKSSEILPEEKSVKPVVTSVNTSGIKKMTDLKNQFTI